MEKIVGVLIVSIVIAVYFWQKEYRKRVRIEQEDSEKDIELTKYIADNLDMTKKLSEIERDYRSQKELSEEIRKIQEKSRLLKHDMKNHSLVLLSYLNEGKLEEAKIYTSQMIDNLNKIYTYINVGNSLLNYILNNKLSMAKELGIDVKAEVENLAFDYMDSIDFSALLNNLLDNAIEASVMSSEKRMEILIGRRKGYDMITVKNRIDTSVLQNNPDLQSTKTEQGHGFGMRQIQNIVEKYEGMIDIYEEEKEFIVNVVYPSQPSFIP